MAERVTSTQVAERAGVSQSAVSRVFTPGASVSEATAEKVRRAASELGYRPNVLARAMITGQSRMIGLVVAYLNNYFYPEAVEALSNAFQARGYHVLMFMTPANAGNIDHILEEILDYQIDAIVMASVSMSSDLTSRCEAAGVPVVLFNRLQDDTRLSGVASDNFDGGYGVASFLAAGGHQRIAHIAGWEGASTARDREAGFRAGLEAAGKSLFARAVGEFDEAAACDAAREMFAGPNRPDAVFVGNDHMAFAVMDALRFELGLDVPGDVSVIGYDDVPIAAWPSYALTTVRQPAQDMVDQTVELVMARIHDAKAPPKRVAVAAPLIVRRSARIPQGWKP
ncbi:MAG: LacI family DNA-binding transcriptional regulator [Pseudomonadota bacterium]